MSRIGIVNTGGEMETHFDKWCIARIIVTFTLAFTLFPEFRVDAQIASAVLSGTVSDTSGASIPEAQISIRNVATGVITQVAANAEGFYTAPALLPGSYEITISAPGFSTGVQKNVTLTVGRQQVLNVTMQVGSTSARVEVTGEAPVVQLSSAAIGDVVNSTTVVDLPLNGRSWTDLALLQPGVTGIHSQAPTTGPDRGQRGLGSQITISGNRPQQNTYLLDGINVQDYSNGGPGSVTGGSIGVDSVQEFAVFTGSYSTQYGRTSGGVINALTRSGTNQFHGDVYEFHRNSVFDAKGFFDSKIPPFHRNQFGAAAGGPIRKDKTFIFGNYEGLRESLGITQVSIVPSQAARNGNLCAPPDCSTTTPIPGGVDPEVSRYLNAFYPLPNGALNCPFTSCVAGAGDAGIFSFAGSQITTENYFTVRPDHRFSEKDSLSATYFYDSAHLSKPDEFDNKFVLDKTRRQLVTISENHVFDNSLVNSARIGYNRVFASAPGGAVPINPDAGKTAFGFVPGDTSGEIHVGGIATFSGGLSPSTPLLWRWNSWQAYDDVFLTKGIHFLKIGANVERIQDNLFGTPHPGGRFFFGSLQAFLSNAPTNFSTDLPGGISPRGIRQTVFGIYVQDDVRFRRNLTINLGLRYEMATVPTEVHNKLASLLNITDAQPHLGAPLFANPTLRNFEPRVGFSWDPFRNGKTAVRGAFGIFDVLPLPIEVAAAITNSAPFYLSGNAKNLAAKSFPSQAFNIVASNPPNTSRVAYVEQHPHRNYVMQWNINVQRQLMESLALTVAYVGNRGIHNVFQADDANIVLPKLYPQGYFWPSLTQTSQNLNPNVGRLPATLWNSDSYYHALELQLSKNMGHGLQGQISYTWARNIDTSSGSGYSDPYSNSITSLFFFNERLRRGLSDIHVGHHMTANYIWKMPEPKSSGIAKWLLGGWQWGGILTISDGTPFTVQISADPLGANSTDPFAYPDRLSGSGCSSLVNSGNVNNYIKLQCFGLPVAPVGFAGTCDPFGSQNVPPTLIPGTCENRLGNAGRNILIGPGLATFDISLFKDHLIPSKRDTFNVQFRAEVFNLFNHPNFASPINNSVLFNTDGTPVNGTNNTGAVDTLTTSARQVQFGIKVIW
jgi:Carboxypeptidase regulatory-like domain/TonB-dependent Receptor Plug Domain/TonB dependent receptor